MATPGKIQISQQEIYDYLISKPKMTRNKALGIMANIKAESDFYSDAIQMGDMKDENRGIGLFQHTYPSRKNGLKEQVPDWETNWKGQIDYALNEQESQNYINTIYNTPEEATKAFMLEFEKPKDQSEENINKRASYSDSLNIDPAAEVNVIETKPEAEIKEKKDLSISSIQDSTEDSVPKYQGLTPDGQIDAPPDRVIINDDGTRTIMLESGEPITVKDGLDSKGNSIYIPVEEGTPLPEGSPLLKMPKHPSQDLDIDNDTIPDVIDPIDNRSEPQTSTIGKMLDEDNDGIPDTIDIDGGKGSPIGQETVSSSIASNEQTEDPLPESKKGINLDAAGGLINTVFKGAGAFLDHIGGPGAIISYIMGKKGLQAAMKEVQPMKRPELSPMFLQHLRQAKELAKQGFHPDEERKIRKEIDASYNQQLQEKVRGTGGDRAKFLAQSGVLDAQRSEALLDYAVKDADMRRGNQDKYEKLMLFKENFDLQKTEQDRAEDLERQQRTKDAAINFTQSAFSRALQGGNTDISSILSKVLGNTNNNVFFNPADNIKR
tara:strand:+ start:14440 stop:16086 length:1647 start_codon:yes stop_codon:yes gene_type:complete